MQVLALPSLRQGQRSNKYVALKTLSDVRVLADKQLDLIKKKAAGIKAGIAEVAVGSTRKTSGRTTTPHKRSKTVMVDEPDLETPTKNSALRSINLAFIMWGNTQRVQIAGVWFSA